MGGHALHADIELKRALDRHQAGHLDEAARGYEAVLRRQSDHPGALHYLGLVTLQRGDHRRALGLLEKALAAAPDDPAVHANLAEACRAGGALDRAAECCRRALDLQPAFPQAANNLGLILLATGETAAAVEQFRHTVTLRPDVALFHNNLGNALRLHGEVPTAVAAFEEAVRLDPGCAEARANLGQLLLELNARERALPHAREAVRLRPDLAEAYNALGNVLRALGRFDEARQSFREAVRLNPGLAVTYNNMAQALQEEGQLREALAWYQEALLRDPRSALIWANMASAAEEQGNFPAAAEHYRVALDIDPRLPEAHHGLGFVRHQQGQLAEAAASYREVIRLRPAFAPGYCNLGSLLEELGDMTGAESSYRTALRYDPALPAAHAQLATLLRGKLAEEDLAALRGVLANPRLTLHQRLALDFGLAHVLDGRGDYAAAADHLRRGNAQCLALWERQGQGYDPDAHSAFVGKLCAVFSPAFFAGVRGFGLDTERPVFVVGLPRSGTTLTEQILASHSRVFGAGELNLVKSGFDSLPLVMGSPLAPADCIPRLDRPTVRGMARHHLDALARLDPSADRVVDKMPDNYLYLGLLATLFPKARIVHCRRDLRDVAVSCWMTNFRHIRWAADPDHLAARFTDYVRVMEHWRRVLPVPVLEVDYRETVDDLEAVARRLIDWCGLGWEPSCLAFHRTARPVRTASVTQVRQPIYRRSVGRWKNYEPVLGSLFARLAAPEPEA